MANSPTGFRSDLVSQRAVSWDRYFLIAIWQIYPVTWQVNALCMCADDVKLYHSIDSRSDCAALKSSLDRLCNWAKAW